MNTITTLAELEETSALIPQFHKKGGLLPVVVQEFATGQILMVAWVNQDAFNYTIENKVAAFFSTSRNSLWIKGESSGNYLIIKEVLIDCDQDSVIYKVTLTKGGVCHTLNQYKQNRHSCFYRKLNFDSKELEFLEK